MRRTHHAAAFTAAALALLAASAAIADDPARDPVNAVAGLDVHHENLEVTLFASEPMLTSPSNIDVDHRGRVWVCEVRNYRFFANPDNPEREAGDRILILEDTTGDGRADKTTVFYQGSDIDAALGVTVLGNRVIVARSPHVLVLTDTTGDDKADKKEVLFSGIGGEDHDHGVHAFVFGPDGRLYFNFGDAGGQLRDADGKPIVDLAGNEINDSGNPYRKGMAFRCEPDGSNVETLGWNFRNPYELAVDSFGTIWQSDNDDDGHRGVRINYVMEFGNYGYTDEMTGAGWRTERTNMEAEEPLRHWHLNDPGVVPNLLQTYAGSPTGIAINEGDLLPGVYRDQMIHADAGPNIVRSYPVDEDGAGYSAEIVNILEGARDNWFRPSSVRIAPDGSLIVSDWYDPGVGGHRMGDVERGRIFRVAPHGHEYHAPELDLDTIEGAIEALKSPNHAVRYLAWTALHERGAEAEPALRELYAHDNPRFRARALWLLGRIEGRGGHYVERAIGDHDPDIRITGIRLARQIGADVIGVVRRLVDDPSPQVRRECAIALRHNESSEAADLWARLAMQHDGDDRWYLEALGIGADGQWDAFFGAWLERVGDAWDTPAGRDIIWRSRSKRAPALLAEIIQGAAEDEQPRYFRALDFHDGPEKEQALHTLLGL